MKRILFLLTIPASLLASNGFYVGGSVGGHMTEATQKGLMLDFSPLTLDVTTELYHKGCDSNLAGMLYAGYGFSWQNLYLAAEAVTQISKSTTKIENQNFITIDLGGGVVDFLNSTSTTKAQTSPWQFGFDVLPGFLVKKNTLLYGRLGVGVTQLRITDNSSVFADIFGLASGTASSVVTKRKTVATLRVGAGLEKALTQKLSLRADYIYTDYGSQSLQNFSTSPLGLTTINLSTNKNVHVYDHAAMLGVNYRYQCSEPNFLDATCEHVYQGCYVGGAIGGGIFAGNLSGNANATNGILNATNILALNLPSNTFQNFFNGMAFLGYGTVNKKLFLGAEAFVSGASHQLLRIKSQGRLTNPNPDVLSLNFDTKIKRSYWRGGIDFRPGVLLTPTTLLAARVGVSASKISTQSQAIHTTIEAGVLALNLTERSSIHQWKAALRLGAGIEHQLTQRWHVRGDYINTNHFKIAFNDTLVGPVIAGVPSTINNRLSAYLRDHALLIGLVYYFGKYS